MSKVFSFVKDKIVAYFFNENVPMVHKNFFLALIYAVIADTFMLICFLSFGFDISVSLVAIGLMVACCGMAYLAIFYGTYKLMTYLFCAILNFIIYPIFYFALGDIYNGACLYFISGVILTFFLTSGPFSILMIVCELLWYNYLLIFTYFHPQVLLSYRFASFDKGALYANFIIAAFIPIFILSYQTEIFYKLRDQDYESNFEIENAESGKTKFLASLTHELRTPMNAIVGLNELILREKLDDASRECAESIRTSSDQLLSIVNNILVYSKLESGKWNVIERKYDFLELIKSVTRAFSIEARNKNIDFNFYIDKNIPSSVYGDEFGIRQIFTYLLYNSIQENERRAVSLEIECTKDVTTNMVTFKCRIAEKGNGISDRDIEAIMGAYKKYDSRMGSYVKGMGLELAICSEILAKMDGKINIESVLGLGIAINFEFSNYILDDYPMIEISESHPTPLILIRKKDDEQICIRIMENLGVSPEYSHGVNNFKDALYNKKPSHIFIKEEDYESVKDVIESSGMEEITYVISSTQRYYGDFGKCKILLSPVSAINISEALNNVWNEKDYLHNNNNNNNNVIFPGARILLVEDSIVNQRVIAGLLELFKVEVDFAKSGQRCLELLATDKYDLIMLEQHLPDMESVMVLHCIKRISEITNTIPVICITSEMGRDVGEYLIEQGFNDYLAKPIKEYHLKRILAKYIPPEFHEYIQVEEKKTVKEENGDKMSNPLEISFEKGIENVGGDEEIYVAILSTYYTEGITKVKDVIKQACDDDLSLFTTNVHALKSSSASVGAVGISEYFKALEFAGKANDRAFIETNLEETLKNYDIVLQMIKEYLAEKGETVSESFEDDMDSSAEVVQIDSEKIKTLLDALSNFNLKTSEEIINEISAMNYGADINAYVKDIKNNFEKFEYFEAKGYVEKLIEFLNK